MPSKMRRVGMLILAAIILFGSWRLFTSTRAGAQDDALLASGTIEATEVLISAEVSGKAQDVLVRTGDPVAAGDMMVRFDDTLLQAQLQQAQAAVAQAEANYALVSAGVPPEQQQAAVEVANLELLQAQQALDALYENANLAAAQAQYAIAVADKTRDRAQQAYDNMQSNAAQADIDAAWAAVVLAKDRLDKARDDFAPYEKKSEDNVRRAAFQSKLADAQSKYDALVTRYNNLIGTSNKYDLALADADLKLAEAKLDDARRQANELVDGIDPDVLALAQERLQAAQAHLALAQAKPTPEQLAVAMAQVENARSAVAIIQAQISKLVVAAPSGGIVLTRHIEAGEVVVTGVPLFTLAKLDDLKLTVYVPEDRYGEVFLGQNVDVRVDSFPGEIFAATVVRIADQAEFTPRNVQTEEGRRTTVFAVELAVKNTDGRLKPGMPADVVFKR